ncbi:MAG: hypothetical protein KAT18_05740 [Candidatus Latescibacteria bacterium]|nr:hypothetical protein [Candidatus Latescibacterota bacterium]
MVHILIGAVATAGLLFVVDYSRRRSLDLRWWQWGLTIPAFLYAVFVLEVIVSLFEEGSVLGALVVGTIMGFVAVVWGVLLGRFLFARKTC